MSGINWNECSVDFGEASYPYYFGEDCLDRIVASMAGYGADRFLVVTDDNVLQLHGEKLLPALARVAPVDVFSRPAGDGAKSLHNLGACLEQAIAAGASRQSVVVAFGGGVPGNLAGVVASLLFRGVRLVHIPTTTVAAMDSVISLKQAINSTHGKNHIGTYRTPEAVYFDAGLLSTLPSKQLRSGLCEATKNCLAIRPQSIAQMRDRLAAGDLASPQTLLWLLEESLEAKCSVMAQDTYEQRAGLILEYGHTVGHAVEMCDQRLRGSDGLSHGEAVMLGMLAAARISNAMGALDDAAVAVHEELARALGVGTEMPGGLLIEDVMDVVRVDNKRGYLTVSGEEAAMVLLGRLGVPLGSHDLPLTAVPLGIVKEAVATLVPDNQ
ncbi:2-deoxy-scyllo-inosose synthase [Streptomyces sp. NPDC058525]|uniref:2-deoxy-scyllo-inosose synthase n=1 Tax=Streptomyces sp. NPDC058525 TaxID=3346538 RepID=UPI00365C64B8